MPTSWSTAELRFDRVVVVTVRFPDRASRRFRFERTFTIGSLPGSDLLLPDTAHQVQVTIAVFDPDVRLEIADTHVRTLRLNGWPVDPDFVHVLHVGDKVEIADHAIVFDLVAGTPAEVRRWFGEQSREPDPAEHEILAALRADPADPDAREVYADWLDGHERCGEAELVRLQWLPTSKYVTDSTAFSSEWMSHQPQAMRFRLRDLAQLSDPGRRALVSRPTVLCGRQQCHRRWEQFELTGLDVTRHCTSCKQDVEFCSTFEALAELGVERLPVALDPILVAERAREAYYRRSQEDEPTNPVGIALDDD